MKLHTVLAFSFSIAVVGAVAGCSSDTSSGTSQTSQTSMPSMAGMPATVATVVAGSTDIEITGFKFTVPASVKPGMQVTIRNTDSVEHSVTADSGDTFDVDVEAGQTAVLTVPSAPGTYAFHCEYHPKMLGVLTVA